MGLENGFARFIGGFIIGNIFFWGIWLILSITFLNFNSINWQTWRFITFGLGIFLCCIFLFIED